MRFYNREKELKNLQEIEKLSQNSSKMSVIVGRRRIGKTKLIKEAYKNAIYFFISKKDEALLCEEFIYILQNSLDIKILGEFKKFSTLFEYIMQLAQNRTFTLIIYEFQ